VIAFVVPDGEPPLLPDLQAHVRAAGLTGAYEPDRLELATELPRTQTGKVRKRELAKRLSRA
jgi:cyclohexanecarboxylate-CoA ligase